MKKLIALLLTFALTLTITACSGGEIEPVSTPTAAPNADNSGNSSDTDSSNLIAYITLSGNTITIDGEGAIVEGNKVSITATGTYYVSGISSNAQIRVYTKRTGTVKLILNGADITCPSSAPIYIINADKTVITLADGTANYVTDGSSYTFDSAASDEPDATIFSNDDLTINGNGSLKVNANYNDGIKSDDDLRITGGVITVNAADDGITGRDSLTVKDGDITIHAVGDGMKTSNDEEAAEGYIVIEGGTLNITASMDGIQAETNVTISGGDITISSGGGSANASSIHHRLNNTNANSTKAIKAGVDITIEGGNIELDSSDDSIHSNGTITIDGGTINAASGDDGIHADSSIEINGGDINITKSYEGIESTTVTINAGNIYVTSSNDGINSARPRHNRESKSTDIQLYINSGLIFIDAGDDGIDVNGIASITGGILIIDNYHADLLDYTSGNIRNFMTEVLIIAIRSSNSDFTRITHQAASSGMLSAVLHYETLQPSGTMLHIETRNGQDILTLAPTQTYMSVLIISPELEMGIDYFVYFGGSSTGTATYGLYSGGTYTAGTQIASFYLSGPVTHVTID